MLSYLPPQVDNLRTEILHRYQILNGSEPYDANQISRTVGLVFDVPIVVIALNERYRHWYRSSQGVAAGSLNQILAFCAQANLSSSTFVVPDIGEDAFFRRDSALTDTANIVFFAGAPLADPDGKRFGTLCLIDHTARNLSAEQIRILDSFAQLVSRDICVRSAGRYAVRDLIGLEEEKCFLFDLAMTDPLTKALNRRAFFRFAEQEVLRSKRHGLGVSVLMIDIDHFKSVNDTHGHKVGDNVLTQLVSAISEGTRDVDLVGRLGGEEFAIILPETGLDQAAILAQRLRKSISHLSFSGEACEFKVSVSIGISMPEMNDLDILPALERADKALYAAKRNGRNRAITIPPPVPVKASGSDSEWVLRRAS